MEEGKFIEKNVTNSPTAEKFEGNTLDVQKKDQLLKEIKSLNISNDNCQKDNDDEQDDLCEKINGSRVVESKGQVGKLDANIECADMGKIEESRDLESKAEYVDLCKIDENRDLEFKDDECVELGKVDKSRDLESKAAECVDSRETDESRNVESRSESEKLDDKNVQVHFDDTANSISDLDSKARVEMEQKIEEMICEEEKEPELIFDGRELLGMEACRSRSTCSLGIDRETEGSVWPEKAVALKKLMKVKSVGAVATVLCRLAGIKDEAELDVSINEDKVASDSSRDSEATETSQKEAERSSWNPLNYIKMSSDVDLKNKSRQGEEVMKEPPLPLVMKGRIILYTRLGCRESKEVRLFLYQKRLSYFEINIDIYPSRRLELEKLTGSSSVPKVFFNVILIGGLSELKALGESGELDEKINYLTTESPPKGSPLPPLSGEDDLSTCGAIDELALIVLKMKEALVVKDRFYKMLRFTSCFLGSEAVDFLSEDQYLEREEAVEFGRKLARKLFFQHVLDENLFEDGNHLYRFLDDDPIVSQCHNIPRGITNAKPKPITEIASRLRFLCYAIFEAYVSEDGMHVDYRSIHGSEEFARYLRIVEELQRVALQDMSREEKLAFFVNLYNMMVIHAILVWDHPNGALERRHLFGDFKYVIGGCTYSLSAVQNGILRGNQRPPYNLVKLFGAKDKRLQVALPYAEPAVHFALVDGTRSSPALRCYSPGNIDQELVDAARSFLRGGGLIICLQAKVASMSMILKWFSVDFGKNEVELLKHASNYLEPNDSEALLEVLANSRLKVIYQRYDWGLNC